MSSRGNFGHWWNEGIFTDAGYAKQSNAPQGGIFKSVTWSSKTNSWTGLPVREKAEQKVNSFHSEGKKQMGLCTTYVSQINTKEFPSHKSNEVLGHRPGSQPQVSWFTDMIGGPNRLGISRVTTMTTLEG